MTKAELRKKYISKRKQLMLDEVEDYSLAIANQSLNLSIWEKSIYSIFLSIADKKEVNTDYLLHILHGKDKNISVSKSNLKTYTMQHFLLTDNTPIKANSWGIPEPQNGIEIQPQQIDVIFIPLLTFDLKGNRVGYGGGFYDRFLAQCKSQSIKIGLSFFEAETFEFEAEENDIPLDYCITPNEIYSF